MFSALSLLPFVFIGQCVVGSALQFNARSNFVGWLSRHGVAFSKVTVSETRFGLGLIATIPIDSGAVLSSIPAGLTIDYESAAAHGVVGHFIAEAYRSQPAGLSASSFLARDSAARLLAIGMLLHFEYFYSASDSMWKPWLDLFPKPEESCTNNSLPRCWSAAENELGSQAAFGPGSNPADFQTGKSPVPRVLAYLN